MLGCVNAFLVSNTMPYIELIMERATLDDLPLGSDAANCAIRSYQSGDEAAWTHIQREADRHNTITAALFTREFGNVVSHLAERVLFAVDPASRLVGTAAAWWESSPTDRWGRVHWVAVQPAWQRQGIGRKLLVSVCHRLRDLGHESVFLTTSPIRHEALYLYLSVGFLPRIVQPSDWEIWQAVASKLGDTKLKAWLRTSGQ
jgi:GNAT superfamily N-acetyltransferase